MINKRTREKKIELISGVGNFPSLKAACDAGADAVYFGIKGLNMRDFGKNFTIKELPNVAKFCHERGVKCYLALNTIVYDKELNLVKRILKRAKKAKVDAVICSDFAVLKEAKKLRLPIHVSTQMSISNSESAEFVRKLGAKRVVLARELSLEQIKEIKKKSKIEIELFIHGSLCISVSGRCYLSLYFHDKSANRGKCTNPCRRVWYLEGEEKEGKRAEIYGNRIISSKDLWTLPFFDKIIKMKPSGLKIEGRNKGPDYTYITTKTYREALDLAMKNKLSAKEKERLEAQVSTVFNRGFFSGFYLRTPDYADIQTSNKSQRTSKLKCIGRVKHFYSKQSVAEINADIDFNVGKEIIVQGKTTYFRQEFKSVEVKHKQVKKVKQGEDVGIKVKEKVRKGDLIYIVD